MNLPWDRRPEFMVELPAGYDDRTRVCPCEGCLLISHPDHPAMLLFPDGELIVITIH